MLTAFIAGVLIATYFLPTIIAVMRVHGNVGAIFALNLFLGWTFVFWVIALVWALYESSSRVVYGAPYKVVSPDESITRGPAPHCMAHDVYWPACYACNMRLHGLSDHGELPGS